MMKSKILLEGDDQEISAGPEAGAWKQLYPQHSGRI
jgi:hypothetical protein